MAGCGVRAVPHLGIWQTQAKTNLQRAKLLTRDLARGRTYLIHDARIFIGDGRVIERGSVLVKESKINQIFEGDGPDAKAVNADVIEAAGKTLMPGLIDLNVHLSSSGMFVPPENPDADIDRELAAYLYSGITAVNSVGDNPESTRKHADAIASGAKLGAEIFVQDRANWAIPGLATIEALTAFSHHSDELLRRSMARQVVPAERLEQAIAALKSSPEAQTLRASLGPLDLEQGKRKLKASYQAGTPLAMGSGSGTPMLVHGPALHRELQLWVDSGLSPAVVLEAATYDAARLLKAENRIGRVREGLEANLLLIEGNPLEQISSTEHIAAVLFKGERINRSELFEQK